MSNGNCPHTEHVAAWTAGELAPAAQVAFAAHLSTCEVCRAEVEMHSRLVDFLRTAPVESASTRLTGSVLQRIREEPVEAHARSRRFWRPLTALAAAVGLLVSGGLWLKLHSERLKVGPALAFQESSSVERALEWFCQNQEPDGSWDAEKWGGNRRFEVALTALPLLVLLEGAETPQRRQAIAQAIAYLRRHQAPNGTFGETFREKPYVQSLCTLALLRAYQRQPNPDLRPSIESALRVVLATQTPDGGWGVQHSPLAVLPVTLWHKEVLEAAVALGWSEAVPSLARVEQWVATHHDYEEPSGDFIQHTGTDYHRAYFAVAHLRTQHTSEARRRVALIRRNLIAHQSSAGRELGTWEPTDQWSRAGGRIYATAMASLALE